MSPKYGTYVQADGSRVAFTDALAAWVPIAHEVLVETAAKYNRTTTYKELTEVVQERSGVRTKMLIGNWSGKLLEQVAVAAVDAGEPPVTSLCVHQDGTIGDGYAFAPKSIPIDPDMAVDDMAAQHRLLCYQRYANDLPMDGGVPTLTPRVADARSRREKADAKKRGICPIHFMELSKTGQCFECE